MPPSGSRPIPGSTPLANSIHWTLLKSPELIANTLAAFSALSPIGRSQRSELLLPSLLRARLIASGHGVPIR